MKLKLTFAHKVFVLTSAILILAGFALLNANSVLALPGLPSPIGGQITDTEFCPCSLGTKITVKGPAGGTFMKVPFVTKVYNYKHLDTGKNVVGKTSMIPYQCIKVTVKPPFCEPKGTYQIISKIGTSE